MPKRFADTKLFDQSWYADLSFESKMIWLFLERSCDHAGIWEIDIPQMRRKLGCNELSLVSFMEEVNMDYSKSTGEPVVVNRVVPVCNNTKLWLTGFISDQYEKGLNGINTAVPAIKSVVNRLKDEGIFEFAVKEGFIRILKPAADLDSEELQFTASSPASETTNIINDNAADTNKEAIHNEESIPLNIPSAKGSEPFERDKDKDKDSGSCSDLKEIGGAGERTKTLAHSRNAVLNITEAPEPDNPASLVRNLFINHWGKNHYTPHEEALTAQLILDYGIDEVRIAFGEAVNHNKLTLAYIKGILQKRRVKQELQKAEEAKKAELHRIASKASEEQSQGIKLNLVESVYGSPGN